MKYNIIEQYKKVTKFLAACLGQEYDVILYEVSKENQELVKLIESNSMNKSSAKSLDTMVKKLINEKEYLIQDSTIKQGGLLKSSKGECSIFYIKQGQDLLGVLCINHHGDKAKDTIARIDAEIKSYFSSIEPFSLVAETENEYYVEDVAVVISNIIEPIIRDNNLLVTRLSYKEKMLLVDELKKQGIFLIKGSVSEVAIQLHSSEASIYRYLNSSKRT